MMDNGDLVEEREREEMVRGGNCCRGGVGLCVCMFLGGNDEINLARMALGLFLYQRYT